MGVGWGQSMTGVMKVESNNSGGNSEVQRWQWFCASLASSPPLFGSPHPCSCLPALVRVSSPFASPHPHSHLPTLIHISPPLFASPHPCLHLPRPRCVSFAPRLHRGLLVVCRFHRSHCRSCHCCFCFCCCCCSCACTHPRSKCPPGSCLAVLCSPSLLAVIKVPVKE